MSSKPIEVAVSAHEVLKRFEETAMPRPEPMGKIHKQLARYAGIYPTPNLAVEVCDNIFCQAAQKALDEGKSEELAKYSGRLAYCSAMPKLSGVGNIRDFIACVTHAMMLDIIPGNEGTRLLYAAQVAHVALTKRPKKRNKTSHTRTAATDVTQTESKS